MRHFSKILMLVVAAFGLLIAPSSVYAQETESESDEGCVIGTNCTPDATVQTSEDRPQPRRRILSKDFVRIALAGTLESDRDAVAAILQANPNVRIANSLEESEFMIARYPDFPNTLILVPETVYGFALSGTSSQADDANDVNQILANLYANFDDDGSPHKLPPIIGSLEDPSFSDTLNAEVQKILWVRRLLAGPIPRTEANVSTEVFGPKRPVCDKEQRCTNPFWTVLRNDSPDPAYIAVMRIDRAFAGTDSLIRLKSDDIVQLQPREAKSIADSEFDATSEADSRYIITISASQPIDLSIFNPRSGALPPLPREWSVTATASPKVTKVVRIGGGFTVTNLATPWQVQLYSTDSSAPSLLAAGRINWQLHEKTHRCGGSLIEMNVVLTAAHCIANAPFATPADRQSVFKYRRIKLGTKDLTRGGTTFAIDAVIVKKGYIPGGNNHDIALIRIKEDASTIARAAAVRQRIPLATRPPGASTIVSAFGWGVMQEASGRNTRISSSGAPQRNPAELQTGDLEILDQNLCRTRPGYRHVTNLMLCAVTPRNSQAAREGRHVFTCLGDSGGPIMGSEGGRRVQVGVVSWAVGCGVNDNPSVSVNVAAYAAWINENKTKFETGKSIER